MTEQEQSQELMQLLFDKGVSAIEYAGYIDEQNKVRN